MTNPFVAEIRIFTGNFAPKGWAMCDGQLLPISQNTALFALLGTTYGGDGKSTFALPDLQGSAPIQQGQGAGLSLRDLGETGGGDSITLLTSEIPAHAHVMSATITQGTTSVASGQQLALASASGGGKQSSASTVNFYSTNTNSLQPMDPQALAIAGGGQPHNNMMPFLGLNYIIALQGVFPPRT
jgi:microcystin-dependent protein